MAPVIATDERLTTFSHTTLYGLWLTDPIPDGQPWGQGRLLHDVAPDGEEDRNAPLLIFTSRDAAHEWLRETAASGDYDSVNLRVALLDVNVGGRFN